MVIKKSILNSIEVKNKILNDDKLLSKIEAVVSKCVNALSSGNNVWWWGNGGSAADAQHLAAELSGRFYFDREPLASEALHVNTSYVTAVANDYSYEQIYSRYLRGCGRKGDILFGISTSGNSKNVVNAFNVAKEKDILTIAMTGESGGKLADIGDFLLNVPSNDTPRIQESHILLGHIVCEMIENRMFKNET